MQTDMQTYIKTKDRTALLTAVSAMLAAGAFSAAAALGAVGAGDAVLTAALLTLLAAGAGLLKRAGGPQLSVVPVLVFCAVASYAAVELLSLGHFTWFSDVGGPLHLFGVLWVLALYLLLYALTGSPRATVIAGGGASLLFGIANYALELFRGRPLLAIDIASIRTALNVTGSYTFRATALFTAAAAFALFAGMLAFLLCPPARVPAPRGLRPAARLLSLTLCGVYVYLCLGTSMLYGNGITINWDENEYEDSAVMYFMVTAQKLAVQAPEGYSSAALDAIAEETEENAGTAAAADGEKPNIIVIMNESFSDLRRLGDLQTNVEVLPFLDSLTENTVRGYVYSSVFGGNTANSEYELLTGDTMAFVPVGSVPYQLYVNYETDTLVSQLEDQGYATTALHPYLSSGWNRVKVYDMFGFDSVHFIDDFANRSYLRNYVTDRCDYENLVRWFTERDPEKPAFLFNITMQNHGGYDFAGFESTVTLTGHEGEFPEAEQYLSLINLTDTANEWLINYFSGVDEPVILLFFGDHEPHLEDGFYDLMYGGDASDLSLEELQRKYMTPFFIWANYDIDEQNVGDISINYLSKLLLDTAGLQSSEYLDFLAQLQESWPAINANGAIDASGTWHSLYDPVFTEDAGIKNYRVLQYNHLFDPTGVRNDIFGLD